MKTGLKKGLLNNMVLKVLSVGLALSLWLYVTYQGQSEMVVDASLEFKNVPKGMELVKQSVRQASLNIRGHEKILRGLRPADGRVVVHATFTQPGTYVLRGLADDGAQDTTHCGCVPGIGEAGR